MSRRNAAIAFSCGAVEVGRGHLPLMVSLHVMFFASCAAEVVALDRPAYPALAMAMLAVIAVTQGMRYWTIATLGPAWNIRVIAIPGATPVRTGLFRYMAHPNYAAVAVEIAAIPLVHTAWLTAIVFTVLNAWFLVVVRIPCENRLLRATRVESGSELD